MSLIITIAHRRDRIEIFVYDRGDGILLYARDDDHADLIVDTIQRGVTNELHIEDTREIY